MSGQKAVLGNGLTQAQLTGKAGEDYTAGWLMRQGWVIVERNWHSRFGEIDIIAQKEDIIAFVEVKTRKHGSLTTPLEAMTTQKQRKIVKTAYAYLLTVHSDAQPRLDVAAVTVRQHRGTTTVEAFEYLEAAFDGSCCE